MTRPAEFTQSCDLIHQPSRYAFPLFVLIFAILYVYRTFWNLFNDTISCSERFFSTDRPNKSLKKIHISRGYSTRSRTVSHARPWIIQRTSRLLFLMIPYCCFPVVDNSSSVTIAWFYRVRVQSDAFKNGFFSPNL